MAEPLAAAVHAVARAGAGASDAAVLGGGTMGLMLARLLVLEGRDVTLCDRHPQRRAQAEALGARAVDAARPPRARHGGRRPPGVLARGDRRTRAPGGTVVLVGGCPAGSEVTLPSGPLHYAELDVRGAFHHTPAEVDRALGLLGSGEVDWRLLAGERIGLDALYAGLVRPTGGEARKLVVDPRL